MQKYKEHTIVFGDLRYETCLLLNQKNNEFEVKIKDVIERGR